MCICGFGWCLLSRVWSDLVWSLDFRKNGVSSKVGCFSKSRRLFSEKLGLRSLSSAQSDSSFPIADVCCLTVCGFALSLRVVCHPTFPLLGIYFLVFFFLACNSLSCSLL